MLRIDLGRIRAVLGEDTFELLRHGARAGGASGDPETEVLMRDALARADTVWLALRPGRGGKMGDSVTILRGRFPGLDPRRGGSGWGPAVDLGAGWRRYDRDRAPSRAAAARLYARADDVLVFVTTAPLDSVERRLEEGAPDAALEPAEKGLLSLDARPQGLGLALLDRAPTAGRLLRQAERLRSTVDLEPRGLVAEAELEFAGAAAAREVAASVGELARALRAEKGLVARLVAGLVVEAVGARVVLRLELPPETVADLLGCVGGKECG